MGRQAYMTRLVLGRSAFDPPETQVTETQRSESSQDITPGSSENATEYVQQYDARGNPEDKASRNAARRSRRALNDILAAAGICVPVKDAKTFLETKQNAAEMERNESDSTVDFEEEIGFWLQMVDSFAQWLTGCIFAGLRKRLLTYNYGRVPVEDILRQQWSRQGISFMVRGLLNHPVFNLIDISWEVAVEMGFEAVVDPAIDRIKSPSQRIRIKRAATVLRFLLASVTHLVLVPIEIQATLQQLGLTNQPLLSPNSFPMSITSWCWSIFPASPSAWTLSSSCKYLTLLSLSPFATFCALQVGTGITHAWVSLFLEESVPSPETLQRRHFSKPGDDLGTLTSTYLRITFKGVLFNVRKAYDICKKLLVDFRELVYSHIKHVFTIIGSRLISKDDSSTEIGALPDRNSTSQIQDGLATHRSEQSTALEPDLEMDAVRSTTPSSPLNPPRDLEDEPSPPPIPEHESGHLLTDTSTPTTPSSPSLPDSIERAKKTGPYHVSPLSTHAADALKYHIQLVFCDFLLIPLASLHVRSVARSYVAAPHLSLRQLSSVVYPAGAWFGAGRWDQRAFYVRNLLLCSGAEVAVSYGIWQVTTGTAWWIGKRWFRWGGL